MENNKTNLEIAKFKIEMAIFLIRCDRMDDADRVWQDGMALLDQEIKAQKEPALKFGPAEPAGPSTRDQDGRAV